MAQDAKAAHAESAPETLNLESLGIALAITWFAMMLWSPTAVPAPLAAQGRDFEMHLLRLTLLAALCIVYLVVQVFPFVLRKKCVKYGAVCLGVAVSPLALLGTVVPWLARACEACPALYFLAWACAGLSAGTMMLVWGYDMSTKVSYRQGVVNIAASSMFSGAFFALCAFLQKEAACVLTMAIPFVMLAAWIVCLRRKSAAASQELEFEQVVHPTVLTNVRLVLGKSTTVFIFSYGFIMGIAGSLGTQFGLSRYAFAYIGISTFAAGLVMLVVLRSKAFSVRREVFVLFLPFSVACLFLLSVVGDAGKMVLLFAIFFVVNSYNVINTAYLGGRDGNENSDRMHDLFSCESRSADMVGSAMGWGAGILIQFVIEGALAPYCYFLIASVLVGVTVASFLRMEDEGSGEKRTPRKEDAPIDSVLTDWENVCDDLAEKYRFSARESEIFLLLSRGRDRQYIHNLLYIAPSTVRTHTYNVYQKMGVHNQQQLIDIVEAEFSKR